VESLSAVSALLYRGALCRSTAATNMNTHSSRSHAVCTLYLEGWDESQPDAPHVASKFHLVDLAG
jgi:transposase